ncbi:MAG: hypothetical protein ACLTDF_01875 [Coprococcus sp.]
MWDECEEQDKPEIHGEHEEYMLLQKQAMFLIEDLELLYDDWDDVLIESQELLFGGARKHLRRIGDCLKLGGEATARLQVVILDRNRILLRVL